MNCKPRCLTAAFILLFSFDIFPASAGIFLPGARSAGLAGSSVASGGAEGLFVNQASLAYEKQMSFLLNYDSRFLIGEYSLMSAGIIIPSKYAGFGASFRQFGTGMYRQAQTGFAVARLFGNQLSAGLQFNYLTIRYPENPDLRKAFSFEAGILWKYSEDLSFGFHYINPASSVSYSGFVFNPGFRMGECWHISQNLSWSFQLEKQRAVPWLLRSGLEFRPVKSLQLRMGFRGLPFHPSGGIGFRFSKYCFDLAFSYHGNLGFSPAAGMIFWL